MSQSQMGAPSTWAAGRLPPGLGNLSVAAWFPRGLAPRGFVHLQLPSRKRPADPQASKSLTWLSKDPKCSEARGYVGSVLHAALTFSLVTKAASARCHSLLICWSLCISRAKFLLVFFHMASVRYLERQRGSPVKRARLPAVSPFSRHMPHHTWLHTWLHTHAATHSYTHGCTCTAVPGYRHGCMCTPVQQCA